MVKRLLQFADRAWQQGRWLRLSQVVWFFRLRLAPRTKPVEIEPEPSRGAMSVASYPRLQQPDKAEFRFLDYSRPVEEDPVNWLPREVERVWRYNLHYFEYLDWETFTPELKSRLINDWIANNPMGSEDAWEPCTVSIRIVCWMKYFATLESVPLHWQRSVFNQARYLTKNIEHEILANHYFKNGKALLSAGVYFDGPEGRRFFRKGMDIVEAELHEQFLADGGHYERTLMYHSIMLEDLVDIVNMTRAQAELFTADFRQLARTKACDAARYLEDLLGADGRIPLFNDAAWGIAPEPEELLTYAERVAGYERAPRPPVPIEINKSSCGYFGYHHGGDSLIIDCGAGAPDYQPGHTHADLLSYEMCLDGQRLIVDSGTYTYAEDERRAWLRSVAAHNTVEVDGHDQFQFWGRFRVGRRARPLNPRIESFDKQGMRFRGAHTGYRRLPQKVTHERCFDVEFTGRWAVKDQLTGTGNCTARSYIHFAPGVELAQLDDHTWQVNPVSGDKLTLKVSELVDAALEQTEFYPRFGAIEPNQTLVLTRSAELPFDMRYSLQRQAG